MINEPATFALSIPDGASWVHVESHESVTIEAGRCMIKEAIDLAKHHGLTGLLLDASTSSNAVSIMDQYQFVHHDLIEMGMGKRWKIAFFVDEQDPSCDFIVTVFRNEGYNCRLFTDKAEAESWLQQGKTRAG